MNKMKWVAFFIFLFFMQHQIAAQSKHIEGKILDGVKDEPLPYCNVIILNTNKGTVSNKVGEFSIYAAPGDSLMFSYLGYEVKTVGVDNFKEDVVKLTPYRYYLNEVIVSSISAEEILHNAIKAVKSNYSMNPANYSAFYREVLQDNDKFTRLLEVAADIYDPGYNVKRNKINEAVKAIAIRSSYDFGFGNGLKHNGIKILLEHNIVKYVSGFLNPDKFKNCNYILDSVSFINKEPVYVISFKPSEKYDGIWFTGKVYIRKKDFAIMEIFYTVKPHAKEWEVRKWNDSLSWNTNYFNTHIKYIEHNKIMYLSYISKRYQNKYFRTDSKVVVNVSNNFSELLINDIKIENVNKISRNEELKDEDLYLQNTAYDPEFWGNYNIIKETTIQEKIRKDLQMEIDLDRQYKTSKEQMERMTKENEKRHRKGK